jgi:hypothetical protein
VTCHDRLRGTNLVEVFLKLIGAFLREFLLALQATPNRAKEIFQCSNRFSSNHSFLSLL